MLNFEQKSHRKALFVSIVVLLCLIIVAVIISTLEFSMQTFSTTIFDWPIDAQIIESPEAQEKSLPYLWNGEGNGFPIIIPLAILAALLTRKGRSKSVILTVLSASIFWIYRDGPLEERVVDVIDGIGRRYSPYQIELLIEQHGIYRWLFSLLISGLIVGIGTYVWWWRRRPQPDSTAEEHPAADIARDALTRLDAGEQLENVILSAYRAMQQTIGETRHIRRKAAVTPREFSTQLANDRILPAPAVDTLTRLFEQVRYGVYTASAQDEQRARIALAAIVAALVRADDETV